MAIAPGALHITFNQPLRFALYGADDSRRGPVAREPGDVGATKNSNATKPCGLTPEGNKQGKGH